MTPGSNDTTHGSLFSGVGGFDLAAEWMGWENLFHCEWNPFGQKVLNYYWPQAESFTDITKTDFTKYANRIDVLSGGFPCQPYSAAGKRLGKEDERHLWPEMLRAIREIQPRYVVGENVRGLTNWNGGMVFDEVQADLEFAGYEVLPFLLPACAKDAPHRRDRIWFVAYNSNSRTESMRRERENEVYESEPAPNTNSGTRREVCGHERGEGGKSKEHPEHSNVGCNGAPANTASNSGYIGFELESHGRQDEAEQVRMGSGRVTTNTNSERGCGGRLEREHAVHVNPPSKINGSISDFSGWPTQSPLCFRNDGFSARLDIKTLSFTGWRNESIKAAGNAIVPQVALEIFKAIEAYNFLPKKFIK